MRRWVTIQQRVEGSPNRSPTGQPLTTWGTYATVPADIKTLTSRGYFAAQLAGSKVNTEILMRYEVGVTDDIDNTMRVMDENGVIYDIESVENVDARNRDLLLRCVSGQNLG